MVMRAHPWTALPPEIAGVLAPALPAVVEEIINSIPAEVPEYARPLEGEFGAAIRQSVQVALGRLFLDLPGREDPAFTPDERRVYRKLGVGEARSGRSLAALLSAYRLGTRLAFSGISKAATDAGLSAEVMTALGESVFVYFDEVSAASIEGYAEEQSRQVGERDRRRRTLLNILLSGRVEESETRHIAGRAGWVLPTQVVVAVLPLDLAEGLRLALGERALVNSYGGQGVAIVPAPTTARARTRLEEALHGRQAWIGPTRPWQSADESHRAATVAASSGLPNPENGQPSWVGDHLRDLIIGADSAMIEELTRRRLAPLGGLRPNQQERLVETLLAWLRHRGERAPIAEELHVHTQTVGYRLGQLREIFGDDLDDPDARFELELVLRAQRLRQAAAHQADDETEQAEHNTDGADAASGADDH